MPDTYVLGILWLATLGAFVFVVQALIRVVLSQMKSYRDHVERLERQLQARDLAEAAAVEAAYAPPSPPRSEEPERRERTSVEEMYADPPRRKAAP